MSKHRLRVFRIFDRVQTYLNEKRQRADAALHRIKVPRREGCYNCLVGQEDLTEYLEPSDVPAKESPEGGSDNLLVTLRS
jgi:hypothetical protein